jgi:hypothetical protein
MVRDKRAVFDFGIVGMPSPFSPVLSELYQKSTKILGYRTCRQPAISPFPSAWEQTYTRQQARRSEPTERNVWLRKTDSISEEVVFID